MDTQKDINKKPIQKLFENGILIGSAGLEVSDDTSDYDIVIHYDKLPQKSKDIKYGNYDVRKYFKFMPPKGKAFVIRKYPLRDDITMDIIIFENENTIDDIKEVMEDLKSLPKCYLKDKFLRIQLFERGLLCKGWIPTFE